MTHRTWGYGGATASVVAFLCACASACSSGSAGGPVVVPFNTDNGSYQQPNGNYDQPTPNYDQPTSGYQGSSSGGSGGSGGSCSYCGQTYSCTIETDGQTDTSTIALQEVNGQCIVGDDGSDAGPPTVFSCDGTLQSGGQTVPWTPSGSGGFSFVIQETETMGGSGEDASTTTTSLTVTCTPQ